MDSFDISQLFSVEGLVAVVTGGGTGIGLYISSALAQNGATVYIIGRRKEKLDQAVEMHRSALRGKLVPLVGDVTSKDDLKRIASQVEKETGYINLLCDNPLKANSDMLVANSGTGGPYTNPIKPLISDDIDALQKHLWEPEFDAFQATFSTNVTGVYFTVIAFLSLLHAGNQKFLEKSGFSSQIIVTSSISGYSKQIQTSVAYSASKAAATHLARSLATYFVHLQIRVNVIAPGLYPSEMTGSTKSDEKGHVSMEGKEESWDDVPARRPGMEREIAGLGVFLASSAAGYLNGAVIVTDGGRLCVRPSVF